MLLLLGADQAIVTLPQRDMGCITRLLALRRLLRRGRRVGMEEVLGDIRALQQPEVLALAWVQAV